MLVCAPGAKSLGRVPDANWTRTYELLTQYLGLPKDKPVTDYYTNDLLPANARRLPVSRWRRRPSPGGASIVGRSVGSSFETRTARSPRSRTSRSRFAAVNSSA